MFIDTRDLHKPTDRDALAREARRLRATGLSTFDIATALRVPVGVVKSFLPPIFDSINQHSGHASERNSP